MKMCKSLACFRQNFIAVFTLLPQRIKSGRFSFNTFLVVAAELISFKPEKYCVMLF